MKANFKFYILIFCSLCCFPLWAEIDLRTGGYLQTENDIKNPNEPSVILLQRTYQSRSLHHGLFGFGWCTQFEKRLEFRQSNQILLYDCLRDRPFEYQLSQIQNSPTRLQFQNLANIDESPDLYYVNSQWHWINGNKIFIFNKDGRLTKVKTTSFTIDLLYNTRKKLRSIKYSDQVFLQLEYDSNNRLVTKIKTSWRENFTYEYSSHLLQRAQSKFFEKTYDYSPQKNLTKSRYIAGGSEPIRTITVQYNAETDTVSHFSRLPSCTTDLSYKKNTKNNTITTQVSERCLNQKKYTLQFIYNKKLQLIEVQQDHLTLEFRYKVQGQLANISTHSNKDLQSEVDLEDLRLQLLTHVGSIRTHFVL